MKRTWFSSIFFAVAMADAHAATAPIRVSDVWSRPAIGTAVVYATIHNNSAEPDSLIGVTSPVATHADLHESSETKMPAMSMSSGSMGNMPMNGSMTSMKTLTAIPVPAGGTTNLKPGGYHLMLDLRHDLRAGETVPLRLHFVRAGWIAVTAIYLFKPQIDAMIDRPYETLWDASPARSASMQAAAAIASVPGSTFNAYQLPRSSHAAVQVLVGSGSDVERVYVHPRTLRVLKSVREDARFTNRISSLHGELLLGDRGSMLVELAASWGIVMIITGLFLWWPRESRGFSGVLYPRLQQGRVLWRDLHAVGGFWVSLFALFFLVSGLPWAASWGSMLTAVRSIGAPAVPKPDWPTGTGSQLGVRAAQNASPAIGGMTAMSEMTAKMRPNVVDLRVLDRIEPVVAKDGLPYPALIAPPSEASATWTARSDTQDRPLRVRLTIDPLTGAIRSRSDFGSLPVVDRVVAVGVAAHEGQLFSPFNQILDLVTAVALVLVTTSAVVMWWSRRPKGVLGAPRALASPRLSLPVLVAIAALGVVLPLFGISLVVVVLLERLVLRRIARVRTFLGLRLDAAPSR